MNIITSTFNLITLDWCPAEYKQAYAIMEFVTLICFAAWFTNAYKQTKE